VTSAEADMIVRPPFLIDRPECEDRGRVGRGPAGETLAPMMLRGGWRQYSGRPAYRADGDDGGGGRRGAADGQAEWLAARRHDAALAERFDVTPESIEWQLPLGS
jgi:hypothetical protein